MIPIQLQEAVKIPIPLVGYYKGVLLHCTKQIICPVCFLFSVGQKYISFCTQSLHPTWWIFFHVSWQRLYIVREVLSLLFLLYTNTN